MAYEKKLCTASHRITLLKYSIKKKPPNIHKKKIPVPIIFSLETQE